MATKKKKQVTPAPPPVRDFSKVRFDLEQLLNRIEQGAGFGDPNKENEDDTNSEAVYKLIEELGDMYNEVEYQRDEAQLELKETKDDFKRIEKRIEDLEEDYEGTEEVNTMMGELKYKTNNLMDGQIMDAFTECLVLVRPVDMLQNLETIKQHKIVY